MEIIVVDDGSRDRTWSIGNIFKANEKGREIKVYHKGNGGKASALKYGISKSNGRIIIMTDGDSGMHSNAVSSIVDTFRKYPDAGIVGGHVFIRNTHTGYLTKLQQLEYIITQHLIRINQSEDGSVLIAPGPIFGMRSDLANSLPPLDRTIVEDCDLTMSVLPTKYSTRSTTQAVSYTTAPTTWINWVRQRKRWIFGQFQAWRENRWHLKRNPWGIYTYFTWVTTTISSFILILTFLFTLLLLLSGGDYYRFLEFVSIRTGLVFIFYILARAVVVMQYEEGRKILPYIPAKIMYDLANGLLTAYLYMKYITGSGVRMSWGNRSEVVH
jgi:cellulose synthase/poly-beta-1,6-N-acetylglucosamine synthase-like glycosyltransferase